MSEVRSERRRRGVTASLLTLIVVGYPLAWALSLTHAAVGGCWLSCGEPRPVRGVVLAIISAALMAAPLGVGMHVARVRSLAAWVGLVVVVALALAGWILFARENPTWFVD